MKHLIYPVLVVLILSPLFAGAEDCQQAGELVRRAYELGDAPQHYPQQRQLYEQALTLCPAHAAAHNNLGWIAEQQGQYAEARRHYRQAVGAEAGLANAWAGLGRVYERSGQFPLALDAYLHACRQKPEVRERITYLLAENRYQVAPDGEIFEKASLLLLFDRERREDMKTMLEQCRFRSGDDFGMRGVDVEAAVEFPNILFELGKATLKAESQRQIREIASALREFDEISIIVNGHTDNTPFAGVTDPVENRRLNMRLSRERAAAVAQELTSLGVPRRRIETHGYGPTQPAVDAATPRARARNRRVEVEVE
jgi:outer membrane protein OmpA-like peptidoglycan-associated protein